MGKLWEPNHTTIGKSESIGRRLFMRQGLKGAMDQKRPDKTFELYHFEDKDPDVSVDRLGETTVNKKVKTYLIPRCHDAATRMTKAVFRGWAVTQAKTLQAPTKGERLTIVPSPMAATNGNDLSENKYHAHIDRPARYEPYEMALHLKNIFESNYHLEPCPPTKGFLHRVGKALEAWWKELRSPKNK